MGITKGAIKLAGFALQNDRCEGRVITFGVQAIQANLEKSICLLNKSGIKTRILPKEIIKTAPFSKHANAIHQDTFFRLFGFDQVDSIDFFPDEKPTHLLDLNHPVPNEMHEKYNLVYDGGTSEHCFSAMESISNAARLAKVGGRIIHHIPMNNWVDHGFYQFSPTLFFDFYEANGFDDLKLAIHFIKKHTEKYTYFDPKKDQPLPYTLGCGTKILAHFSARKRHSLEEISFPIQGRYRSTFGGEQNAQRNRRTAWERFTQSLLNRTIIYRSTTL